MKRIWIIVVLTFICGVIIGGCKRKEVLRVHDAEVTATVTKVDSRGSTLLVHKFRDNVTGEVGEINAIHSPLHVGDHFEREVWVPRVRSEQQH